MALPRRQQWPEDEIISHAFFFFFPPFPHLLLQFLFFFPLHCWGLQDSGPWLCAITISTERWSLRFYCFLLFISAQAVCQICCQQCSFHSTPQSGHFITVMLILLSFPALFNFSFYLNADNDVNDPRCKCVTCSVEKAGTRVIGCVAFPVRL